MALRLDLGHRRQRIALHPRCREHRPLHRLGLGRTTQHLPGGGDQLAGSDLKAHVQRQIRTWAAPFRDLIDATDPTDIGPVPLRTMPQLPAWEPSNVTLIGDASTT